MSKDEHVENLENVTFSQLVAEVFEREQASLDKGTKAKQEGKAGTGDTAFTLSVAARVALVLVLIAVVGTLLLSLIV